MLARIFRPAKSAMQSGRANTDVWELLFEPSSARTPDPLMGWTVTADTRGQVRLVFDKKDQAIDYAQRHGLPFEIIEDEKTPIIIRSYADNFAFGRKIPWTH